MTCICRTQPIPKPLSIDVFVPSKKAGELRLADQFHKDCEIHGMKDLTPEPKEATTPSQSKEENANEPRNSDQPPPSNAQDTGSS